MTGTASSEPSSTIPASRAVSDPVGRRERGGMTLMLRPRRLHRRVIAPACVPGEPPEADRSRSRCRLAGPSAWASSGRARVVWVGWRLTRSALGDSGAVFDLSVRLARSKRMNEELDTAGLVAAFARPALTASHFVPCKELTFDPSTFTTHRSCSLR